MAKKAWNARTWTSNGANVGCVEKFARVTNNAAKRGFAIVPSETLGSECLEADRGFRVC